MENDLNAILKKLVLAMGAMGTMVMAGGAWADTDTANLSVGAAVVNACAISAGAIHFGTLALEVNAGLGTVTGASHDANSEATISIACTHGASAATTLTSAQTPRAVSAR